MFRLNQKEMLNLILGLEKRDIEFDLYSFLDGIQVQCTGFDVICNSGSYGHKEGLLEVYGLPQCAGDVLGYLTAEEVLKLIDECDDFEEPEDIDDDFGFDPYEGCYTYDC